MPESKLNILVVTQYFWPENMRINDLVRDFTEKGHSVTVLTGVPNYPEGKVFEAYKSAPGKFTEYHGARIVRVPMIPRGKRSIQLILNYLSFFQCFDRWRLRAAGTHFRCRIRLRSLPHHGGYSCPGDRSLEESPRIHLDSGFVAGNTEGGWCIEKTSVTVHGRSNGVLDL